MHPRRKWRGQAGTTGTACIDAGFRVPGGGDSAGTRGDKWRGQATRRKCGFGLSPRVPASLDRAGTPEPLYSCGVPACPRCPREEQDEPQ